MKNTIGSYLSIGPIVKNVFNLLIQLYLKQKPLRKKIPEGFQQSNFKLITLFYLILFIFTGHRILINSMYFFITQPVFEFVNNSTFKKYLDLSVT